MFIDVYLFLINLKNKDFFFKTGHSLSQMLVICQNCNVMDITAQFAKCMVISITARKPQIYYYITREVIPIADLLWYHAGGNTHYLPHAMRERNGNYLPGGLGQENVSQNFSKKNFFKLFFFNFVFHF